MVESAREVCSSVRVGEKKPKSVWWNDEMKAAVRRKEAAWKGALAASNGGKCKKSMRLSKSWGGKSKKCGV